MAYMRGHFYIYSDGASVHFHHGHGQSFEIEGKHFEGEDTNGSVDDNSYCPWEPGRHPDSSHVSLPIYIVEEFVAMYWARMDDEERMATIERVRDKYVGGSFGADGVAESLGLPTVMDVVLEHAERLKGDG